jgi:site-specific recombinase XerD
MKHPTYDDMPQLLQDYLKNYLTVTKNRSKNTVNEYYYDLRDIFQFIKRDKYNIKIENYKEIDISDLDLNFFKSIEVSDIYNYLYDKNTKAISRARKISSIKSFYKYLCDITKKIERNPTSGLEAPKLEKRLPKYLNLDESVALLHSVDGEFKERDFAIITLFLNCGLRLSELVGINLEHIKGDTLSVIGKGNKERSVHLNKACLDAIETYLRVRPQDKVKGDDRRALFLSKRFKRISPRMVEIMVKQYIIEAGLDPKKYTPHKLRHTAATLMHKHAGVDIRTLQQVLGHETIATTQIYTHIDSDEVKSAIDNNPLNKLK